jgi:hypothetical protein
MISSSIAEICDLAPSGDSYHGRVRSSDQLQQLKKSVTLLPTAIAIMDGSDHQINFNSLKKYATSLSSMIGALGSPLGSHPESDLVTDLYSSSISIANMDESGYQISFNSLNKSVISLSAVIGALGSPLGPPSRKRSRNRSILCLYPHCYQDKPICWISFNNLIKYVISLLATIEALGSPLGPHTESDLAIDIYSGCTPNPR